MLKPEECLRALVAHPRGELRRDGFGQLAALTGGRAFHVRQSRALGPTLEAIATELRGRFTARLRIDTPKEREYYRNGGILHYVLRQLAREAKAA